MRHTRAIIAKSMSREVKSMRRKRILLIMLALVLLLAACSGTDVSPSGERTKAATELAQLPKPTKALSPPATRRAPPPTATQSPDYRWNQLLGRDDIRPIYSPEFVSAGDAGYVDGELVMGVEIDGRAKAYPVGLLNEREMVNDELAGIPILVTW
jgi:hypothetical protein